MNVDAGGSMTSYTLEVITYLQCIKLLFIGHQIISKQARIIKYYAGKCFQ